ncbi:LCP family protein [Gardnerella sp. 2492-Sm]|uniref:LCP family protein n=1 Tax=unclassified Gardnerella TaxID=2628112 RepID=UPI003D066056
MVTSRYPEGMHYPTDDDWDSEAPHHSLSYRLTNHARTVICMFIIAVLTFFSSIFAAVWFDFSSTIKARVVNVISNDKQAHEALDANYGKTVTFLVLGQDTREGANRSFGGGGDATDHQSDTTMIVQISADRSYMNIVSIPRDSMVNAPSCETTRGTIPARRHVMFNSIFALGWAKGGDLSSAASCSLKAVNALTGLHISNFIIADFSGLSNMIDSVGGVDMCIPADTRDRYTGANFKQGLQHLDGRQATQYARMRHDTMSDGSDIMRTTRQQYLVKQLVRQASSKNLFTQSSELYQLAKSSLNALNMSEGLANPSTLVSLALSMRKLDASHIYARTVPIITDPLDKNRVVWSKDAESVWNLMREDKPVTMATDSHKQSKDSSSKNSNSADNSEDNDANESENDRLNRVSSKSSSNSSNLGPVDPETGLAKNSRGQLIDPNTGGVVNPKNGTIIDPVSGQYVGYADKYVNNTICAPHKTAK